MFLRRLTGLAFLGAMAFSATAAETVVRVRPPHLVVEKRSPPPSRNHVWVSGYHRWEGNAYAWTPGRWEQPPRQRARWVPHHWVHRHGGWILVDGHWR